MLRRYGPILLVIIVIVGVIAYVGSRGDDDDNVNATDTSADSASALPLTYQEAKDKGTEGDIDWGATCDTETGRVKMPVHNAYPCVEPPAASADNGGATSPGVTADSIIVALYKGQPDPLQQAIVEGAGADTDPNAVNQTSIDYLNMFADVAETYGRTLDIRTVEASGGPADATAAQADAQKVIDMGAFAALGGPGQTPAWWQEIVAAKIVCMCGAAESETASQDNAPYLWPTGPTPEQADAHLLELVGKQLVGKKAEFAGDPALQAKDRVFGWVQAETETGEYKNRNDAFDAELKDKYGAEVAARSTYLYDPANAADIATTVVARMKEANVTTIIISTDPLIPAQITAEATKQNYFPEWVIGPSVLADTTIFGRTFDQQQWTHAIGLSLPTARTDRTLTDSYTSYKWYYGKEVAVNSQAVLYPAPYAFAARRPPRRSEPHAGDVPGGHVPLPARQERPHLRVHVVGRQAVAEDRLQLERRRHRDLVGPDGDGQGRGRERRHRDAPLRRRRQALPARRLADRAAPLLRAGGIGDGVRQVAGPDAGVSGVAGVARRGLVAAPGRCRERGTDLVGNRDGDEPLLERHADTLVRLEHEAPDLLTAGQHRELGAFARELELAARVVPHRRAGDGAVALDGGERHQDRRRLEPARAEVEQVAQLLLRAQQHVLAARAVRGELRHAVNAVDLAARVPGRGSRLARPPGKEADRDTHQEEEQRGLDVVARVHRQRQVRLRVEEVERERGDDRADRARLPAARDRGEHDDEDEQQCDVGVRNGVTDTDERAGDDDRADRTDRHSHRASELPFFHIHRCTFRLLRAAVALAHA